MITFLLELPLWFWYSFVWYLFLVILSDWFFLLPAWLIFNGLTWLLGNWWFPLFATRQLGPVNNGASMAVEPRLPSWMSWAMTYDNSLYGDGGFREGHDGGYWSQVAWLYRNNAYGFERCVLAAHIASTDSVRFWGDPFIADKPNGKSGWCFVRIGDYWSFDVVIRWGWSAKCFKLSLGWKLKTYAEDPSRIKTQPIAQYCVTIGPMKDFVK